MTNNIHQEFNQINKGISDQTVLELFKHIEEKLPNFPTPSLYATILAKIDNENQYSEAFCVYMNNESKSKSYNFSRELVQKKNHTIDISVYIGDYLIFVIEAKILPTPQAKKSKSRAEYEYVYGKGGGIQRFKDGFHGFNNQTGSLFTESGMIAYIKEQDFEYWLSKINQWILEAEWDNSEQLEKIYFKQIAKLFSKHPRQNAVAINLYHFWVYV